MRSLLVFLALVAACGGAQRPRVDRADQLPVHRYPVTGDVGRLVVDEAAFAALAHPLRADLERDLAQFDIRDPESLKARMFVLALLDALDDHWPEALAHGGTPDAFRAALERKIATMPVDLVRNDLSILRTMGQVFSPDICRELVSKEIGPHVKAGALSFEQVQAIAFQRYAVVRLAPVGKAIDEVLGAHGIEAQK